jgi:hypothetical protein
LTLLFLATAVPPALAESGARTDNSMTLVYVFLGVCALIIFLQLIPVLSLGFGLIKGVLGGKETVAKPVPVRNHKF